MLTLRARWLLVGGLVLLIIGVMTPHAVAGLLGIVVLLWIIGEGVLFSYRARWVVRGLRLQREIRDDRGVVTSLWSSRIFEVRLRLVLDSVTPLPYLAFEEPVPFGVEVTSGTPQGEGGVSTSQPLEVQYHIRAPRPGAVRFEGVRIELADLHGLFHHIGFVRLEETYRVLPALVDAEGKTATSKRYNLLIPPGIHRLPRPGAGSELLDLRDYIPGDPPRTIAWKVSARRDRLITREYESEVPIRCTLFIDISQSVRLGPPGHNALTRLTEIASGVAQANLASRDLTGLCLFDEETTRIVKPARTRRHIVQLFTELADAAALAPTAGVANVDVLLPLAYAFAQEVYPEQLDQGVNQVPFWMPFLVRVPVHWLAPRNRSLVVFLFRWFAWLAVTGIYFGLGALIYDELSQLYQDIPEGWREEILADAEAFMPLAVLLLLCLGYPLWMLLWRDALPLLFSPRKRRITRMRKKLAALFAARYELGAGGVELLLQDDQHLGVYLERFLNEHHIPHTPQLFDRKGQYLFASLRKIDVLAAALLRAVGKGHDNELFILFVDLVNLSHDLSPLMRAVKVAISRHHQVMVIVPWPPELHPPGREEPPRPARGRPTAARPPGGPSALADPIQRLDERRYVDAFQEARRTFARLQVPVVCAADADPVALILDRLDRLRSLRRRR